MKSVIFPIVIGSLVLGALASCTITTDSPQQGSSRRNMRSYSGQTLPEWKFGSGKGMGRMRWGSGQMMRPAWYNSGNAMQGSGQMMMGSGSFWSGEHMGPMIWN